MEPASGWDFDCPTLALQYTTQCSTPSLLQVNKEARQQALLVYKKCFEGTRGTAVQNTIWINPRLDTLFIEFPAVGPNSRAEFGYAAVGPKEDWKDSDHLLPDFWEKRSTVGFIFKCFNLPDADKNEYKVVLMVMPVERRATRRECLVVMDEKIEEGGFEGRCEGVDRFKNVKTWERVCLMNLRSWERWVREFEWRNRRNRL